MTHKAQKVTGPTYEAQLELIGPGGNLEELTVSRRSPRDSQKCVSDSTVPRIFRVSLVRPRSFFSLGQAHPLTQAWCKSYSFKTFELSYQGSCHLDDPLLFEAYIRPPIVTLEHTI